MHTRTAVATAPSSARSTWTLRRSSPRSKHRACAAEVVRASRPGGSGAPCASNAGATRCVVCNADEGDPGAYIDRVLLEDDPHAVLEGMAIAGLACGASHGLRVRPRKEYPQAGAALAALGRRGARARASSATACSDSDRSFDVDVVDGAGQLRVRRGDRAARTRSKDGAPRCVLDRRTPPSVGCTALPRWSTTSRPSPRRRGSSGMAARRMPAMGSTHEPGHEGRVAQLVVRPAGSATRSSSAMPGADIVDGLGGGLDAGALRGVLVGGPLAGILPPHLLDTPLGFEELRAVGAEVGHGGIVAFDERTRRSPSSCTTCSAFGAYESCGKCTPCRVGAGSRGALRRRARGRPARRGPRRGSGATSSTRWRSASLCGHGTGLAAFATQRAHLLLGRGRVVPRVTVDGQTGDVPDGATILDAATGLGVEIPTLCHDPRLVSSGACRLCVVTVDGEARPVAACTTPVRDGMVVTTARRRARRRCVGTLLRMLADRYPAGAPTSRPRRAVPPACCATTASPSQRSTRRTTYASTIRTRRSASTCRAASRAGGACASATRCRASSCGRSPGEAPRRRDRARLGHDAGRELVRLVRRVRRHLPERRARGPDRRRARRADALDPHHVPVLRRRLRAAGRHPRRPDHRCRSPALDAPVNRGHLCVKGRYGSGFVHAADRVDHADGARERRLASRRLGRGDRRGRRRSAPDPSSGTGRTRSACSARPAPPTRTTTSSRSSPASCSAPTTSTAARGCATRRARRRCAACSAPAQRRTRSTTSSGRRRSSSAAPTPPRTIPSSAPASSRRRGAVRDSIVIDPRRIELAGYADVHLQLAPGHEHPRAQRDGRRDPRRRPRRRVLRRRARRRRSTSSPPSFARSDPERRAPTRAASKRAGIRAAARLLRRPPRPRCRSTASGSPSTTRAPRR